MKYDAIIIGSGQGGTPLSMALADKGWNVALIEKRYLGGTCINTGCTPTKTMVQRAQVAHYARNAARWGVHPNDGGVDLPAIVAQTDKVVHHFRGGREKQVKERPNLRWYRDSARFTGPHQVAAGGELLESDKIFIDTGGRPRIPPVPGLDTVGYLTNERIMGLATVPDHLVVMGAGYIGLEFAQMFRRFGSRVTVIQAAGQIVPREDPEVAAELQKALEAEGVQFLLGTEVTRAENRGSSIELSLQGNGASSIIAGSHLLVATGRRPNTDDLDLDKAGIATDKLGFVRVNGKLETNVPGVWALGDVKGGPAFTHISYNDYQIVWANIFEGKNLSIDHRIVPYCLFTDPQLGSVGLTEKEARAKGYKLKIGSVPMSNVSRAVECDETSGLMKLIVDAANDRILGATILSRDGGETVHIPYTLMLADLPYTLLKGAVYIHPTWAEGLFFLMDAVKRVS
jgi:pyruvate/2-oxoglutarate dehydrogenase complex dihydrolipoamide dehydrogenase (E3) component